MAGPLKPWLSSGTTHYYIVYCHKECIEVEHKFEEEF